MSTSCQQTLPNDVAGKVLRRAEVAKMARRLQDRLALASYKTQHGQEDLSFHDVEASLERTMKRNRPLSSAGTSSTSSSSGSSDHPIFSGGLNSSPLTAPVFSDDLRSSENTNSKATRKRNFFRSTAIGLASEPDKRPRSQSMAPPMFHSSQTSWKSSHNLPQSSPVHHHRQSPFSSSHAPAILFETTATTSIPDSPHFGQIPEEGETDLSKHSFRMDLSSSFRSSPPRTPPPTRRRAARQRKGNAAGEEGADLLLYLATSPSPAAPGTKSARTFAPSTPPAQNQTLPSSMMSTPGMAGFNTPGQQFNFADFVNITPSPAQGAFGNRTPGLARTPLAAKEARRRLNFDTLVPPSGSPNLSNIGRGSVNKDSGLGMELGGELVS